MHPAFRRRGLGTQLMRELLQSGSRCALLHVRACSADRTRVSGQARQKGTKGKGTMPMAVYTCRKLPDCNMTEVTRLERS